MLLISTVVMNKRELRVESRGEEMREEGVGEKERKECGF